MGNNGDGNLHILGGQEDTEPKTREVAGDSIKAKLILRILLTEDNKIMFQAVGDVHKNRQFLVNACLDVAKSILNFPEPKIIQPVGGVGGFRKFLRGGKN